MSMGLLVAVVADELEEHARDIIRQEGAQGITILSAGGIGFPEHITFFGLTYRGIESVLLCLLDEETAEQTAERLNRELDLLKPFRGLAFCIPVDHAEGIDWQAIQQHVRAERATRSTG